LKLSAILLVLSIVCSYLRHVFAFIAFNVYLRHLFRDQIKSIFLFVSEVYFIITINYLSLKYVKVMKTFLIFQKTNQDLVIFNHLWAPTDSSTDCRFELNATDICETFIVILVRLSIIPNVGSTFVELVFLFLFYDFYASLFQL